MGSVQPVGDSGHLENLKNSSPPDPVKQQCQYGIDAVIAFIELFEKDGIISKKDGNQLINQLHYYKQQLDEGTLSASDLVKLIEQESHIFKSNTKKELPEFTLATGQHLKSGVLSQINMFEQFVTQAHKTHKLGDDELQLFSKELEPLWKSVESGQLSPSDAMTRLGSLIQGVNTKLPDHLFPLPDPDGYGTSAASA